MFYLYEASKCPSVSRGSGNNSSGARYYHVFSMTSILMCLFVETENITETCNETPNMLIPTVDC